MRVYGSEDPCVVVRVVVCAIVNVCYSDGVLL